MRLAGAQGHVLGLRLVYFGFGDPGLWLVHLDHNSNALQRDDYTQLAGDSTMTPAFPVQDFDLL